MSGPLDAYVKRAKWAERLTFDTTVSMAGARLGSILAAKFFENGFGDAYPSVATLAKLMDISERQVTRLLDHLVDRGHLARRDRVGQTTVYRPIAVAEPLTETSEVSDYTPDTGVTTPRQECQGLDVSPLTLVSPTPDIGVTQSLTTDTHEEKKDSISSSNSPLPAKRKAKAARQEEPPGFGSWWSIYPRRVGRDDALRIYARIIREKRTTEAELLAGAERYALSRASEDPKYTKHPATWLNKGCWHDEAEALAVPRRGEGQASFTEQMISAEAHRRGYAA